NAGDLNPDHNGRVQDGIGDAFRQFAVGILGHAGFLEAGQAPDSNELCTPGREYLEKNALVAVFRSDGQSSLAIAVYPACFTGCESISEPECLQLSPVGKAY